MGTLQDYHNFLITGYMFLFGILKLWLNYRKSAGNIFCDN